MLKLIGLAGLLLAVAMVARRDNTLRVPKTVLYSHYRVVVKLGDNIVTCGTGVAIGQRKLLTAAHVVEPGQQFEIDIFDDNGKEIRTISCRLIAKDCDPVVDLALVETTEDLPVYNELDLDDFDVGSWGYIVGCAHATVPYNVFVGIFSSKYGPNKLSLLSQMAITVAPGQSGGGVYRADSHKLVGILVRGREGYSLFVPSRTIQKFLDSIP